MIHISKCAARRAGDPALAFPSPLSPHPRAKSIRCVHQASSVCKKIDAKETHPRTSKIPCCLDSQDSTEPTGWSCAPLSKVLNPATPPCSHLRGENTSHICHRGISWGKHRAQCQMHNQPSTIASHDSKERAPVPEIKTMLEEHGRLVFAEMTFQKHS